MMRRPGISAAGNVGARAWPHAATFPVMGIRVRFESDDRRPLEIAEEAFGSWRSLESRPDLIEDDPVLVRVSMASGRESAGPHAPIDYRVTRPGRLTISAPGNRAVSDVARRQAEIVVTEGLLADRQHFRYGVLEAATLFILSHLDRQPVHAAVVMRRGVGLLLAGPSGAGKSTLAYAAVTRLGCSVLAEDVVSVQMRPALRLWGMPGFLHLPVTTIEHFPELAGNEPTLRANGKTKIAVALRRIAAVPPLPVASRAGICVLDRSDGPASLEPIEPAAVIDALTRRAEPGFDLFAATIGGCMAALAAGGGWRLRTTSRPADALPLLDRALAAIAEG